MINAILRLPTVQKRTGLARSTIYWHIARGNFPKPISLGAQSVGWIESEIQEWLSKQIDKSRNIDSL
jgi:prophage regulatory protein